MKELNIEQKAQMYDEALKKAKEFKNNPFAGYDGTDLISALFPELKESEDERIRKELIRAFNSLNTIKVWNGIERTDILAWLEKQGEQNSSDEVEPIEWSGKINSRNVKGVLKEMLDKKLKPDDKVEPKFNVGDKIQYLKGCGTIMTIEKIENDEYIFANNMGHTTIEDGNKWYLVEHKSADKPEPKFKVKYAGSEYNVFETKDIAGVTFYGIEDEPNHIDYVKADNCEIISVYCIKESGLSIPTKPVMFSEQETAEWSKEDEVKDNWELIHEFVNKFGRIPKDEDELNVLVEYVLKRQKPTEWGEEDEKMLNLIIAVFEVNHPNEYFKANELNDPNMRAVYTEEIVTWLKSLKDRIQPLKQTIKE